MIKRILIITVLLLMLFQSTAFAQTVGEIVARDSIYGAGVGALLGTAVWLINTDKDVLSSIGIGITVGTFGGLLVGFLDAKSSLASIDKDGVKFAMPTVRIQQTEGGLVYSTTLLKVRVEDPF